MVLVWKDGKKNTEPGELFGTITSCGWMMGNASGCLLGFSLISIRATLWGRLWWFGDIECKDDADCVKWCMLMEIEGSGHTGHTKTWWDCVRKDVERFGVSHVRIGISWELANHGLPKELPFKWCGVCVHLSHLQRWLVMHRSWSRNNSLMISYWVQYFDGGSSAARTACFLYKSCSKNSKNFTSEEPGKPE